MKKDSISLWVTLLPLSSLPLVAVADDRLQRLESRIMALEQSAQHSHATESDAGQRIRLDGVVEVALRRDMPANGVSVNDLATPTFELNLATTFSSHVAANVTLLHEDGFPLDVDSATLTIGNDASPILWTLGQTTLPFGQHTTLMVEDPLTLSLGEIAARPIIAAITPTEGVSLQLYMFDGNAPSSDNGLKQSGVALDWQWQTEGSRGRVGLGTISNMDESDSLAKADRRMAGHAIYAQMNLGDLAMVAEYITAADRYESGQISHNGQGAKPSALQVEVGYPFDLSGIGAAVALSLQQSREALALELPRQRIALALNTELESGVAIGVEYARERDYGTSDTGETHDSDAAMTGSGDTSSYLVVKLGLTF
jgi:hypothetical protein